jgi:WD40 repeat protein
MQTGMPMHRFTKHRDTITAIAVTAKGGTLASASLDHTVRTWDLATGRGSVLLDDERQPIRHLALAPDGRRLWTAGPDQSIRAWDLETAQPIRKIWLPFPGHRRYVGDLAFSRDGKLLTSASSDNTAIVWQVPDAETLRKAAKPKNDDPKQKSSNDRSEPERQRGFSLAGARAPTYQTSPDAARAGDWQLCAFQEPAEAKPAPSRKPQNPEPLHIFRPDGGLRSAALSPDGQVVATGNTLGVIHLLDTDRGIVKKALKGQDVPGQSRRRRCPRL